MKGLSGPITAIVLAVSATGGCTAVPDDALRTTPAMDAWLRAGQPAIRDDVVPNPRSRSQDRPSEPAAAVRDDVGRTLTGRVTGINRNAGHVTILTPDGNTIQLLVPPAAVAAMREGDDIALDLRVTSTSSSR
jgi:hypothetical protein